METLNLSKGKEAASPKPDLEVSPSQLSASQESTHSMGGTVGGMFVLCGLVPLVGRDSVVHEPATRGTIPGSSVTGLPEVLMISAPPGGKRGIPIPLPLSLLHFFLDYLIFCA